MMDDKSIDDFFAKKDKSKKKKKGGPKKFTTTETITKAIHDQQAAKKEQEQIESTQMPSPFIKASIPPMETTTTVVKGDDEWIDFKQKEKADFSALDLEDLNISSSGNAQEDQPKLENATEDDEKVDDAATPWQGDVIRQKNIPDDTEEQQPQTIETPAPASQDAQPESTATPKTGGKYIPPALKRALEGKAGGDDQGTPAPAKSTGKYVPPSRRRTQDGPGSDNIYSERSYVVPSRRGGHKVDAPSLHDEAEFPSLTDSIPKESKENAPVTQRSFEYVRHGGRPSGLASSQPVELDNKYQSLSN
ncbi:hypothetical protein TrispH2_008412 [Trichoplax sp. H2]|nr:hypothetical protein TrispH2_008412 [Trichoplax sp. H2]|eukprot:RDD40634.1 hypothetical protein TrispH2_008412 [Trichoplax sp. H2]